MLLCINHVCHHVIQDLSSLFNRYLLWNLPGDFRINFFKIFYGNWNYQGKHSTAEWFGRNFLYSYEKGLTYTLNLAENPDFGAQKKGVDLYASRLLSENI